KRGPHNANATSARKDSSASKSQDARLLHDARPRRLSGLLLRRRRDHECSPYVPAVGPVLTGEFPVALEVHVALIVVADFEDVADLRSDADDTRFEAADPVATSAVAGKLLVDVSDEANLRFLGQELRRAPIEVHIDAVLVIRERV